MTHMTINHFLILFLCCILILSITLINIAYADEENQTTEEEIIKEEQESNVVELALSEKK